MRWHCPPDTGFEIRALAVWGRARYLSVTEAPHNTDFHTWMGKKHLCFFQTAETGNRTPNSGVKGSGANHYPRAPARMLTYLLAKRHQWITDRCSDKRWLNVEPTSTDVGPALNQRFVPHSEFRWYMSVRRSASFWSGDAFIYSGCVFVTS